MLLKTAEGAPPIQAGGGPGVGTPGPSGEERGLAVGL